VVTPLMVLLGGGRPPAEAGIRTGCADRRPIGLNFLKQIIGVARGWRNVNCRGEAVSPDVKVVDCLASFSSPSSSQPTVFLWTQLYLGLGFTTMATLIMELALTRIFSVVFYYHFAFLAISVALFGLGAGGVFSYVIAARPGNIYRSLARWRCPRVCRLSLVLWFILSRESNGVWTLTAVYFASAVPFFLAGAVVSIAIRKASNACIRPTSSTWPARRSAASC
jgi:hypothetical protein